MSRGPIEVTADTADLPAVPHRRETHSPSWQQNPAKLILRRFVKIYNLLPLHRFPQPTLLFPHLFVQKTQQPHLYIEACVFSRPLRPGVEARPIL